MPSERMSGADAAWLHMDRPENLMVVNTVLRFETTPNWNDVEEILQEGLVERHSRFRQRAADPFITLGLSAPAWQPVATRARDHIVRAALPLPGDARALHAYVAAQAKLPLDPGRPLWEVHAIDGYGAGAALLLRTHHAIGDGRALVEVITGLTEPCAPRQAATGQPLRHRSLDEHPRGVIADADAFVKLAGRLIGWPGWERPRLTGNKTMASLAPVSLKRLKEAARPTGSTVNDFILTAVAGALRSLAPAELCSDADVVVPIDLRPPGSVNGRLGNRFGLAFVRLPVASAEPGERLALVTRRMRQIKESREGALVFGGLGVAGRLPRLAERAWIDAFIKDAVAVVTNVMGPAEPVTLAGSKIAGMCFWVPSSGPLGIGVSVVSYAGDVVIGLVVDDGVVADGVRLARAIEAELGGLVASGAPRPDSPMAPRRSIRSVEGVAATQ